MSFADWLRALLALLALVHLVRAGRGLATGRCTLGGEVCLRVEAPRRFGLEIGIDLALALYFAWLVALPWREDLPSWLGAAMLLAVIGPALARALATGSAGFLGSRYRRDRRPQVYWTLVALGAGLAALGLAILIVEGQAPARQAGARAATAASNRDSHLTVPGTVTSLSLDRPS